MTLRVLSVFLYMVVSCYDIRKCYERAKTVLNYFFPFNVFFSRDGNIKNLPNSSELEMLLVTFSCLLPDIIFTVEQERN